MGEAALRGALIGAVLGITLISCGPSTNPEDYGKISDTDAITAANILSHTAKNLGSPTSTGYTIKPPTLTLSSLSAPPKSLEAAADESSGNELSSLGYTLNDDGRWVGTARNGGTPTLIFYKHADGLVITLDVTDRANFVPGAPLNSLLIDPTDPNSVPDPRKVDFEIRVDVDVTSGKSYHVLMYITTGKIPLNTDSTDTYTFTSYKDGSVSGTPVGTLTMTNIQVTATNEGETVSGSFDTSYSGYAMSGTFNKDSLTGGTVKNPSDGSTIGTVTCAGGTCTYKESSTSNTWTLSD